METAFHQPAFPVFKQLRLHPVADHNQIRVVVLVNIGPDRIGDHAGFGHFGRYYFGLVGEAAFAIVDQQIRVRRFSVGKAHHAATHKQIRVAIAVKIARPHARFIVEHGRQVGEAAREIAFAIIEIQPVELLGHFAIKFVTATDHVQIQILVAVGIEKRRVRILKGRICLKSGGLGFSEHTVLLLHK